MRQAASYTIVPFSLFILHTTVVRFLAIGDTVPDILVVWIAYIAIRDGQLPATVAGFGVGLVLDLVSGGQEGMLGLSALAKSTCGFVAGYFHNENKTEQTLRGWKFIIIIAVASVLHNFVYFFIFFQGSHIGWGEAIAVYGVPATLYTTVAGLVPMFVFAQKYRT